MSTKTRLWHEHDWHAALRSERPPGGGTHNEPHCEPDLSYFDKCRRVHAQQRAINQLRALGYEVTITPKEPAA